MTTVQDILNFVESIAPRDLKMDWDNVGLHCGRRDTPVTKILVALDPFIHVCREAADWGAQVIVTHHPLIFQAPKEITDRTEIGQSILTLCAHGISAINAHTNLDCADNGVNDVLAQTLGLENIQTIEGQNLLRMGEYSAEFEAFLAQVKEKLGCEGLRYVSAGKPVSRVAVGGGSCASALREVKAAGCDTFVTADVKYNQFWDAKNMGINLIDAGHFHTENPVVAVLAEKLREKFPEVTVKISETHADCMKYY